jgi:hypothetical protein
MDHNSKSTGGAVAQVCTEVRAPKTETLHAVTYRVFADNAGDIYVQDMRLHREIDMSPSAAVAIAKAILALTSDAQAPAPAPVAAPAPIASAKPAPKRAHSIHPWAKMRVGENFFSAGRIRPNPKALAATHGKRFTSRAATEDGVDGFLVWRMS